MNVVKVVPRGYCYGVVDAVQIARRLASDPGVPRPIHVLGAIVHNRHVVAELAALGVHTLEREGATRMALLASMPRDGGTVVFTAHGIAPDVRARAAELGFHVVDASCPEVQRTHAVIRHLAAMGADIVFIGRRGHPEPEGAMGEAPGHVHLVERAADLDRLSFAPAQRVAVVTQTTLSVWDTAALIDEVKRRWPHVEVHNEICRATEERQEAAVEAARKADLVIVVGDARSNNTGRLVEVVRAQAGKPAYRVDCVQEIDPVWLAGHQTVAVTAGSSTPSDRTREVIRYLEAWPGASASAGSSLRRARA